MSLPTRSAGRKSSTGFGVTPETFTPSIHGVLSLIHPTDVPAVEATIERAVREHAPFECEYRVLRSDGCIRAVCARGASSTDAEGGIRVYGTAQDVTESKQ